MLTKKVISGIKKEIGFPNTIAVCKRVNMPISIFPFSKSEIVAWRRDNYSANSAIHAQRNNLPTYIVSEKIIKIALCNKQTL